MALMTREWSANELNSGIDTKSFFSEPNGGYTDERVMLHDRLVDEQLSGHHRQFQPHLTITSGGTASGKTDAAKKARETLGDSVYVNTDVMRARLPEFALIKGTDKAGLLQEEAGDIRDQLLSEAIESRMNVVWDAPGSSAVAAVISDIQEEDGYTITIAYTHRPVDEAKVAAKHRAQNASNPADQRIVPDDVIEASHRKAREGFGIMAHVPGREVIVYDKTGKSQGSPADVIYHKAATGEVSVHVHEQVKRFATSGKPQMDLSIF
jgi:predicted ABC-type ATPase